MVIDHGVDRAHARGRVLAEDVRLDVHEHEPVELLELLERDRAHLDADAFDERAVLGARHLAERDQRRGRAFAA